MTKLERNKEDDQIENEENRDKEGVHIIIIIMLALSSTLRAPLRLRQ